MDWIEKGGTWRSGPYTIELIAPEMWALSRDSGDRDDAVVEVDDWWTDRSLRAIKRKAESLEADRQRIRGRDRHILIMSGAIVFAAVAANVSGVVGSVLLLGAVGTAVRSLVRALERTFVRRPWEFVNKNYP